MKIFRIVLYFGLAIFFAVSFYLWQHSTLFQDLGLNLLTEIVGIIITVVFVEMIFKVSKLKEYEPIKAASYIDIRIFVNRYIIFLQNLFRYSVEEPEPKLLESLLSIESIEKIFANLDLNASPLIEPKRSMVQYLKESGDDLYMLGEKILDRFGNHLDPKTYKYIHDTIESNFILNLRNFIPNFLHISKSKGIPKPMILASYSTKLDAEQFISILSLYKWCEEIYNKNKKKYNMQELFRRYTQKLCSE